MDFVEREKRICLGIHPVLSRVAMFVTQDLILRNFFKRRIVIGAENLPLCGSVILAPTHRSRWDALMLTMAAGRRITNRDCRFMVTKSEMKGIQGWFLKRLGCFSINQNNPSLSTLRYSVDLLVGGQQLVVFPEGKIMREICSQNKLHQGLIRIAKLAHKQNVQVKILPIGLGYSDSIPKPFTKAAICFAKPIVVKEFGKDAVDNIISELSESMNVAEEAALKAVGRNTNRTII